MTADPRPGGPEPTDAEVDAIFAELVARWRNPETGPTTDRSTSDRPTSDRPPAPSRSDRPDPTQPNPVQPDPYGWLRPGRSDETVVRRFPPAPPAPPIAPTSTQAASASPLPAPQVRPDPGPAPAPLTWRGPTGGDRAGDGPDDDLEPYRPELVPIGRPRWPVLAGWTAMVLAVIATLVAIFGVPLPHWVGWIAIGGFLGGFGLLVAQLPRHRDPDAGDGAVL